MPNLTLGVLLASRVVEAIAEDAQVALIHFKVQVRDRTHLARVIRTLRRVKQVRRVARPPAVARAHTQDAA